MTELLMALSMLSVAGLLAIRLFDQSMHVVQASAQAPAFQLDQMAQLLRADVWRVKRIQFRTPNTADLAMSDGKSVSWEFGAHEISRIEWSEATTQPTVVTGGRPPQQWTTPVEFIPKLTDRTLVLQSASDQWRFTAPLLSEPSP